MLRAGNDGDSGYQSTFAYTDPSTVIVGNKLTTPNTPVGGLNFSSVDASLYAGGLHSFSSDTASKPICAQKVTVGSLDVSLVFQWNDPFDADAVTIDYNILVFDSTGAYQSGMSGTDTNPSSGDLGLTGTDEPIEMPGTALTASATYYLVICRATLTSNTAPRPRASATRPRATAAGSAATISTSTTSKPTATTAPPTARAWQRTFTMRSRT